MATVGKKNLKQFITNRDAILNDNSESTIPKAEPSISVLDSIIGVEETTPSTREQTKKDHNIDLQTTTEQKQESKQRNTHIAKIERPKREISITTRVTKDEYESLYNRAIKCNCKSVSDYVYYLITNDK